MKDTQFKNLIKEALTPDFLKEPVNERIGFILGAWPDGDPHKPYDKDFEIIFNPDNPQVDVFVKRVWKILDKYNIESEHDNMTHGHGKYKIIIKKPTASALDDIFDMLPPSKVVDAMGWNMDDISSINEEVVMYNGEEHEVMRHVDDELGKRVYIRRKAPSTKLGKLDAFWVKPEDIEESVNEEEGWHRQKKYSMDDVKKEIDLMMQQGEALLLYQEGDYGEIGEYEAWESLKDDLIELHQQSVVGNIEGFTKFVEGNDGNDLPNSSSGSFLTALTDIDGLLSAMNFEEENDNEEEIYSQEEWDEAVAYWRERVNKLRRY